MMVFSCTVVDAALDALKESGIRALHMVGAAMDKEAQAEIERYFCNKKRAELNQEPTDSD